MNHATNLSRWETDGGQIDEPGPTLTDHDERQLAAVIERLCGEFAPDGGTAAESISDQVRDDRAAFGSPRVTTYLPILVERTIRRRLRVARDELSRDVAAAAASSGP